MRFYHYADEQVDFRRDEVYEQSERGHAKPSGFWVSIGAGWANWCRSEGFRTSTLKVKHEVFLKEDASILFITSDIQLDDFTRKYGSDHPKSSNRHIREMERGKRFPVSMFSMELTDIPYTMDIDWNRVAEKYQGIVIAPYIYSRRLSLHTQWYYGWDCASGCIWDIKAIKSLRKVVRNGQTKKTA